MTEIERAFIKSDRTTLARRIKNLKLRDCQIDYKTGIPKYALCESGCNGEINHTQFIDRLKSKLLQRQEENDG